MYLDAVIDAPMHAKCNPLFPFLSSIPIFNSVFCSSQSIVSISPQQQARCNAVWPSLFLAMGLFLRCAFSNFNVSMSPFAAAAINGVFLKKSQAFISDNEINARTTSFFCLNIAIIKGESPFSFRRLKYNCSPKFSIKYRIISQSLQSVIANISKFSYSLKRGLVSITTLKHSLSPFINISFACQKVKGARVLTSHCGNLQNSNIFLIFIQRQQIVMGSYNSKQQELQYHSQHENAIYGKGTIFSSNKLPNCYVIKTLRLLHDEQIFKLFEEIQNNQNIYLLSLYGYIMGKSCQCQVERVFQKCVLTYWEFLSFSLKDCIEYRRRISVPFHQHEIWHIIKAAVFGYAAFERVNVYFQFQEEYLLINHEGRIRISWQHVQGKNEHLKYYKMEKEWRRLLELERGQSSGETKGSRSGPKDGNNYRNLLWSKIKNQQLYYSPEQLRSIANLQPVHPQVKLLSIQHLYPRHASPPPMHPPTPYVTILQLLYHRLQQDQSSHGQSIVQDVFQSLADLDRDDAQLRSVQKDHSAGNKRELRVDDER